MGRLPRWSAASPARPLPRWSAASPARPLRSNEQGRRGGWGIGRGVEGAVDAGGGGGALARLRPSSVGGSMRTAADAGAVGGWVGERVCIRV